MKNFQTSLDIIKVFRLKNKKILKIKIEKFI